MSFPTDSQWARYSVLCAQLWPLPLAARQAQLAAWQAARTEEPQVLSLVALHYALPPDADRDRTGERLGNFTLEAPLGAGGMGIVYRAQQHLGLTTRPVAVKLIHPALLRTAREEALARFQAEMGTLAKLEHESIARIYDGGIGEDPHTHEPLPYIAMELVRGGLPLTTYARDYALAWPERLALFVRVCHAVRYAHEHRVIHRDLKPGNILVDSDGRPVILDFGLAQACDAVLPGAHLASGTPAYMSPEQVSDVWGAVSDKSDVYALGLMLYELLTGQHPYAQLCDGSAAQLRQVITEVTPPPLSQHDHAYGGDLDALVAAALAKQPADRPSVAVLRSRLERALQQLPPDSDRPRRPTAQPDLDQPSTKSPPPPIQPEPSTALPPAAGPSSGLGRAGSGRPDAERRQLTILFCDIVDSTYLAGQRDPEDWREVVRAYQQTCEEVIQRFDGSIAQWLGDGLLVYFGWPQAHEDDALRAVWTGLGLLEALGPLNTRLAHVHGLRLAIRVGIHTGLVVVGAVGSGRQEWLALGDTPNIASRLQGLATPDTVVMSAATFHLVEGYCTVEDLGRQALKGVAAPLQVYQVVGASAVQSRLEVAAATGLTPLVGRDAEVALLCERWAQSRDGQGQVVLLRGEAGIGKSRLVEELTARVGGEGALRLLFRCSPYHTHSAFFPVIAHLQRLLHWDQDEAPEARVTTLEQVLRPYGFALQDVVPLFAALLSVPLPERYPPLTLSPQQQKQQTQEALVAWLLAEAERQPVLAVWEDLHWADPSSLEFLSLLIARTPTAPLLTLLACRPEFDPPWSARAQVTQLTLTRFTRAQIEAMVMHIAGGKRLPAEVVQQVVAKTDGVPLFVEELTKAIVESGLLRETAERYELKAPLPALAIPTTLQDALMARLDRLGTAKGLAQLAATIGRQFAYNLLQEVAQLDDTTIQRELGRLVEAELLYPRGQPPQVIYRFKHALIQDAAYQSLLKSTRQHYHQRIAQVLAEQFPDTAATQPELLAHHYTEAGLNAQAVQFWHHAGQYASARSAHMEATGHLTKGLEVLQTLPETPERMHQDLALQLLLGQGLIAIKGYAAPDVQRTYARSRELCQQLGETPQLFWALWGLQTFYMVRAELQTAWELGEQLLRLAQHQHDPALLLEAHYTLGNTLFWRGELTPAQEHLEHSYALYPPEPRRSLLVRRSTDPAVGSLSTMALTLWLLGYPDQALERIHAALTLARELAHPFSLAHALNYAAGLHLARGEGRLAHERAEATIALATEQGFPHWQAGGAILQGWTLAEHGHQEQGIAQMRQSIATVQAIGAEVMCSWYLGMLAEAYRQAGQIEAGLSVVAEALGLVEQHGERFGEAELYRLKGELLLRQATPDEPGAESCWRQALDIARRQQARSLELRVAMSLSRLWQQRGKRDVARQVLAATYGWFTEGLNTADLQEAKALLEVLA